EYLLGHGADPNLADDLGEAPLHSAIGSGRPTAEIEACLGLLLAHGADPGAPDLNGHTPLRHALWAGERPALRLLEQHGAPMYRPRPRWEPPGEIIRLVERILTEAWNGPVVLGDCYQLRGERVLRFEIAAAPEGGDRPAPASVVVKQARRDAARPYDPDTADQPNGAWGLFEDWAGTRLFSSLPNGADYATRFYGGDRTAGVIVIEDLGDGEALVDCLMGDDPKRAEEGLLLLARCLGQMHAATVGLHDRYWGYRDALGPRLDRAGRQLHNGQLRELQQGFAAIGVRPASGFEAEFQQVAAAISDPGPFLAYVHGDPCPDNCRILDGKLRLFDFETSGFQHALLDAVYGRLTFPTCWCVNRLPAHIAPMMESVYRAELVQTCPAAGDDRRFQRELVHCCAFWVIWQGEWRLENAGRDDSRWGISTWRQRVLVRLDALAGATEEFHHLPAMGETARRCTERLRQIWPAEADQMPLYPAFRGEAG
ncbi:MAG TPA: ankyrin repeat domain-containing protein, partial [Bryobacteraceae bacterium]|nr:ankyrin repeat domain-containing protein [Bryobacteraceae bacterium]